MNELINGLVYIKEINDKNGNIKHLLIHRLGLKLGTVEELITLANRKIPNDIKNEDQVFYKIILAHIMERILFNKSVYIDIDIAYKIEKDSNVKESIIRKFYEIIGGEPGKFVYLGNLVKDWNKKDIVNLYSQWKNKTGVFLLYFNSKRE
jgi:hypothetical protein